ncbi:MAG TPA: hypothetical protein VFT49_03820 [Candidatus Saccharimonadales bacterium]|nr:hypothetical protein [Candidatus Saccharimonadales bacterium]
MKLQYTATLPTDLSTRYILVDSTALIHAAYSDEFLKLLTDIVGAGCTLFTIPSVVYEYSRSADTPAKLKQRLEFIKELKIAVLNRVEEEIEKHSIFLVAYNRTFNKRNPGPSYTDSLLCAMAYRFKHMQPLILSANHKDIPQSIFDRTELITIDISGGLQNEALYEFSESKFSKLLEELEKT